MNARRKRYDKTLTVLPHALIKSLVNRQSIVVVLWTIHPALREVQVYAIIARLGDLHSIFFEGLNAQTP
jgi:hypothetical protein